MPTEITMPKLSDTMEEGTVLKWRIKSGDHVSAGDIIAEVETDKAAMEMEAFDEGVVQEIKVEEGETVPVGTVIAIFAAEEEEKKAPEPEKKKAVGEVKEERKEKAPEEKEEKEKKEKEAPEEKEKKEKEAPEEKEEKEKKEKEAPEEKEEKEEEEKPVAARKERREEEAVSAAAASPAARQLARERGLTLSDIRGTGPGGRIVLADVEKVLAKEGEIHKEEGKPPGEKKEKARKSVRIRRVVAGKMVESWQHAPHFFVTVAVDMTDVIRFRKSLGVSINDFILAATARSLKKHPWVNSFWENGEIVEQESIHVAMAVATERGLYNPVVKNCGDLSLKEISRRAAELGEKAHAGKLSQQDLEGGTFTVSNMGMLGVESFTAIITPPQAAVLAVGTVKGEVIVDDKEEPGIAPIVRLTLSADHRILDGADAAEFLADLKSYLEAPVTLITGD
jgi:pyruvate dehydrogenase E2 component (dihydrolipoamide acetyltransferase)